VWRPLASGGDDPAIADPSVPRLWIAGHRYALLGRLARGEGSDVFLGRRELGVEERVVVKILRTEGSRDLFAAEDETLRRLAQSSARGAPHFTRLVPERIAFGAARLGASGQDGARTVAVRRWRSGFVHTLRDLRGAYPSGFEPAHAVWMWKRMLESIGFVHESGLVHGAILPEHVLVHAGEHGAVLTGFSRAVRPGEVLPAVTASARDLYPDAAWSGGGVGIEVDLAMSARSMLWTLGGDPLRAPTTVPAPLARLLEGVATGTRATNAWALVDEISAVAREVFGPPRFVPFDVPSGSHR
jgi:hypothetical protein